MDQNYANECVNPMFINNESNNFSFVTISRTFEAQKEFRSQSYPKINFLILAFKLECLLSMKTIVFKMKLPSFIEKTEKNANE